MGKATSKNTDLSEQEAVDTENLNIAPNAREIIKRRYLRKGADGEPIETIPEMFHRVAGHVAAVEATWDGTADDREADFYDLLTTFRFLPNSPTFTGAGTPLGQLAACFVLPIADDMGREDDGIFQTLRNMALIQQTGGGTGFSFSRLRPKGALVLSSGGQATGPIGFLSVFDTASEIISQGGARRGANMAVLRVDHPDIREFITCKNDEGEITNFNLSVGVTDDFMQAVAENSEIDLVNPQDGEVWDTVDANELFDAIVANAYRNGEPGMLFLDTANRDNPCPHLGEYEATNPCLIGKTWVTTERGPVQIKDIVGEPQHLLLNGEFHATAKEGFFFTGEKEVLEIRTHRGFRIQVTPDHPLRYVTRMTRYVIESEWRQAGDLDVGDEILLGDNRQTAWKGRGTWDEGYLLGLLVGDGTITIGKAVISVWGEEEGAASIRAETERIATNLPQREDFQGFIWLEDRKEARLTLKSIYDLALSFGLSEEFKGVSPEIERTSSDFHRGFLRGLFDADGTVIGSQHKGVSVRLAQSDLPLLQAVQRMLQRLGILSTIYTDRRQRGTRRLPDGKGGVKSYPVKAQHEIVISRENLLHYQEQIGFTQQEKATRLRERLAAYRRRINRERFVDRIVSIEPQGKAAVYDVQVTGQHAFDANGFYVHNCGEQFLLPYENCCLGAVNLAAHLVADDDGAHIDWDALAATIRRTTRFLDDVVEANAYVPAVPQLREAAHRTRRIGLGITGLADVLYQLRVRYGSPAAQELAAQIMEFIRYHAMRTSIDLAQTRGPFPAIKGSLYDPDHLRWTPPQPVMPYTDAERWGRPTLDWNEITEGIRAHGIRNAAQTTVAPTGTRSTIAGVEGYGCEPVFALAYVRHVHEGEEERLDLHYTSPLFQQALDEAGLDAETQQQIIEEVARSGSCRDVKALPEELREVFVTAGDITAEEHVRMQAALQAFVDASISKTINFPADAAPEDVASAFQLAWELGCKGLTVYVTGSREDVVLETQETQSAKQPQSAAAPPQDDAVRPRPHTLPGRTYRLATPLGTAYTTVNTNGHGEPFEVFLNVGKVGSDTAAVAEAIGRLISLVLRVPSPLSSTDRLQQVVRQLKGIGGGRPLGFGPDKVRSLPDGVAQVLTEHLKTYTPCAEAESPPEQSTARSKPAPTAPAGTGDLCPDCGNATLISEEGCRHCTTCGYSEC